MRKLLMITAALLFAIIVLTCTVPSSQHYSMSRDAGITYITDGMTESEYLNAINGNMQIFVDLRDRYLVNMLSDGSHLVSNMNSNFTSIATSFAVAGLETLYWYDNGATVRQKINDNFDKLYAGIDNWDAAAAAYFANITLSRDDSIALNGLVIAWKSLGLWDSTIAIYPILGTSATDHQWNLKDPRNDNGAYRITWVGAGFTHSANNVKFSGAANNYGKPFINPSLFGANLANGWYFTDEVTQNGNVFGAYASASSQFRAWLRAISSRFYVGTGNIQHSTYYSRGFLQYLRRSTTQMILKDDHKVYSGTSGAVIPNLNIYIGCYNNNNSSAVEFINNNWRFGYFARGFTESNQYSIDSIVNIFLTHTNKKIVSFGNFQLDSTGNDNFSQQVFKNGATYPSMAGDYPVIITQCNQYKLAIKRNSYISPRKVYFSTNSGISYDYNNFFTDADSISDAIIFPSGRIYLFNRNLKIYRSDDSLKTYTQIYMKESDGVTNYTYHTPVNTDYPGSYFETITGIEVVQVRGKWTAFWGNYTNVPFGHGASPVNVYKLVDGENPKVIYKFGLVPITWEDDGTADGGFPGNRMGDPTNSIDSVRHVHAVRFNPLDSTIWVSTGDNHWVGNVNQGCMLVNLDTAGNYIKRYDYTLTSTYKIGSMCFFGDSVIYTSDVNIAGVPVHYKGIYKAKYSEWGDTLKQVRVLAADTTFLDIQMNGAQVVATISDYALPRGKIYYSETYGNPKTWSGVVLGGSAVDLSFDRISDGVDDKQRFLVKNYFNNYTYFQSSILFNIH